MADPTTTTDAITQIVYYANQYLGPAGAGIAFFIYRWASSAAKQAYALGERIAVGQENLAAGQKYLAEKIEELVEHIKDLDRKP